jgi:hypothetical protein
MATAMALRAGSCRATSSLLCIRVHVLLAKKDAGGAGQHRSLRTLAGLFRLVLAALTAAMAPQAAVLEAYVLFRLFGHVLLGARKRSGRHRSVLALAHEGAAFSSVNGRRRRRGDAHAVHARLAAVLAAAVVPALGLPVRACPRARVRYVQVVQSRK